MKYEYANLSPYDFEMLVADIMQQEHGVPVERFAPGPDGGIDLRLYKAGTTIVQCKNYATSPFSTFKTAVKLELPKLSKIDVDRYVLVTSCRLSPQNKTKLMDLGIPSLKSMADVWSRSDLDAFLDKHPNIARLHFKLWITGSGILEGVLHKASFLLSDWQLEELWSSSRKFVTTKFTEHLFDCLDEHGSCIITGVPGIGKTTLAQIACIDYFNSDFDVHVVSDAISVLELWNPDAKQIFLYDDFLGQSSLADKLDKGEDNVLVAIVRKVAHDPKKRFIMTTREYILQDAMQTYEKLGLVAQKLSKITLRIGDFSDLEKARILYNHLHFSTIGDEQWDEFVSKRMYRQIIEHDSFSPRIVDWMTTSHRLEGLSADEYLESFLSMLNDPSDLWAHALEYQLSKDSRAVVLGLASLGGEASVLRLKVQVAAIAGLAAHAFKHALRQLDDSFITIVKSKEETRVRFGDPSIRDICLRFTAESLDEYCAMLETNLDWTSVAGIPPILAQLDDSSARRRVTKVLLQSWECVLKLATAYTTYHVKQGTVLYSLHPERVILLARLAFAGEDKDLAGRAFALIEQYTQEFDCGPADELVELAGELQAADLISSKRFQEWCGSWRTKILDVDGGIEGLEELARLTEAQAMPLTADETETLEERIGSDLWESIEPTLDADDSEDTRAEYVGRLEDIAEALKVDVQYEIDQIWESGDHDEPDYDDYHERSTAGGQEPMRVDGPDPIDDLFRSRG